MGIRGRNFHFLLHLNAEDGTYKLAKRLRRSSTKAEKILWNELKGRKLLGYKFRRQHPIHFYVADFYCHEQRLVVEVDGKIHMKPRVLENDQNREEELSRFGIRIIRFSNEQVIKNISEVKKKIINFIIENTLIL